MRLTELLDHPGIVDDRRDFEAVAHDARISKQTSGIRFTESGDPIDFVTSERGAKGGAFLQNRQPGQSCLVDLQHQPLKQHCLVLGGEAVFAIMIGAVPRMARRETAIGGAHVTSRGS